MTLFPADQVFPEQRPGFLQAVGIVSNEVWSLPTDAIEAIARNRREPAPRRYAAFHALAAQWNKAPPLPRIQDLFRELDDDGQRFLCDACSMHLVDATESVLRALLDVGTYSYRVKDRIYRSLMRVRSRAAYAYALAQWEGPAWPESTSHDRDEVLAYLLAMNDARDAERLGREYAALDQTRRAGILHELTFRRMPVPASVVAIEELELKAMQDRGLGVLRSYPRQTVSATLQIRLELAAQLAMAGSRLGLEELRERLTAPASRNDRLLAIIIAGNAYDQWNRFQWEWHSGLASCERPADLEDDPQRKTILEWISSCLDNPA